MKNTTKRPPLRAIFRRLLLPAACAAAVAGVGILRVASRVTGVDEGYRLSKLQTKWRALTLENNRLRIELATLQRPARLEKIASGRFGMHSVAPGAVISVPRADSERGGEVVASNRVLPGPLVK